MRSRNRVTLGDVGDFGRGCAFPVVRKGGSVNRAVDSHLHRSIPRDNVT